MKSKVYCIVKNGLLDFYVTCNGNSYYLFQQKYRKGVYRYYCNGIILNNAIKFSKSHYDTAIMKVMEKIPSYICYIEKEYNVSIMNKTIYKQNFRYLKSA